MTQTVSLLDLEPGLEPGMTTGIGSLPFHNIDSAIESAFQNDIPYFPQTPMRNPWEFMIAQALDGIPGLKLEPAGFVSLDLTQWSYGAKAYAEKLERAFSSENDGVTLFEPGSSSASAWKSFLFELEEQEIRIAKAQIAGPLTCQWVLRLTDGSPIDQHPEISSVVLRHVLARALAMGRQIQRAGSFPIIFLDEPGLCVFSKKNPRHVLALQEMKLALTTLRKEGFMTGIHCCSETDWPLILALGADIISLDTGLSLGRLLSEPESVTRFIEAHGRFAFGAIPTGTNLGLKAADYNSLDADGIARGISAELEKSIPHLADRVFKEALWTPACGLALRSSEDALAVCSTLLRLGKRVRSLAKK